MKRTLWLWIPSVLMIAGCTPEGAGGGGWGGATPPPPAPVEEANVVVALEAEPHPDVAAAFMDLESIELENSQTGARQVIAVSAELPADLGALAGAHALATAADLPDESYDTVKIRINRLSIIDSNGHPVNVQLTSVASTTTLSQALTTKDLATLSVHLNLDRDLAVNPVLGSATWTPKVGASVSTTASVGSAQVPLRLAGGVVEDTTGSNSLRLAVDPQRRVTIPIELNQGFVGETTAGRRVVSDPQTFVTDEVWGGRNLEFDGPFVTGVYRARPSSVVVGGGISQVVQTGWDPILRGVVTTVAPDQSWFEMLVITARGPGSPQTFATVRVVPQSGTGWTVLFRGKIGEPRITPGVEVLANTLPEPNGTFAADRVELRETVVFARPDPTPQDPTRHRIVRISGVNVTRLGLDLTLPLESTGSLAVAVVGEGLTLLRRFDTRGSLDD